MQRFSRRAFVSMLAALAAGAAITFKSDGIYAQQSAPPRRIGALIGGTSLGSNQAQRFRQELLDAGYADGRDVVIEWRFAMATTIGYRS